MNHFSGIGRLTGAAELKYTAKGTACTKFSICINKTWKDSNGVKQEKANFFNCIMWGKYGELMQKYLTRGKQIAIEAELEQNTWEDDSGGKHSQVVLNVNQLYLLASPRGESAPANDEPPPPPKQGSDKPPDDIPF
jgi:single-strand DNA-binding protein